MDELDGIETTTSGTVVVVLEGTGQAMRGKTSVILIIKSECECEENKAPNYIQIRAYYSNPPRSLTLFPTDSNLTILLRMQKAVGDGALD